LPEAIEMVEKWKIPISFPSKIFRTILPANPRTVADPCIVVPYGVRIVYSSL